MSQSNTSRLEGLRITATDDQSESLVLSLQAVFRAYGQELDYDELAAVTGTAFMVTCAPGAPEPGWWPVYGRHCYLEPAARTYGLSVRGLHPPDAAPDAPAPTEYDQHFRDSYVPFVEAALARDEPALAWMGWPAPHEMLWGVVTEIDEASKRCAGHCCADPGKRLELTGSPVQVYLVQDAAAARPSPQELLDAALRRAGSILNNRVDASFGVITGAAALERWRDVLDAEGRRRAPSPGNASKPGESRSVTDVAVFHRRMAWFLVRGRQSAMRFFKRFARNADSDQTEIVDRCVAAFEEAVGLMEPSCDVDRVREQLQSDSGHADLIKALTRTIACERRAAEATAHLAGLP